MTGIMLETKRLILRKAEVADADDLLEINHDEVVLKYNCISPMTKEEMIENIQKDETNHRLAIELKEIHKIIGNIDIERDSLRYGVRCSMISYELNTLYTGKGYMSEAIKEVLRYLFDDVKVDLVSARVFTPNEKSNRLLQKLGFTLEGTLKHAVKAYKDIIYDDNLYCLTKDEYYRLFI